MRVHGRTLDGTLSIYDQHIRGIAGAGCGDPRRLSSLVHRAGADSAGGLAEGYRQGEYAESAGDVAGRVEGGSLA